MKIGLFFGSFNPVHIGHLIIAQACLNETDLDKVWFIISPQSPFKQRKNLLNETHRYQMVELATGSNLNLEASNVEFFLPRPSYTIDTLTHLREKYPSYTFTLIMGEDNLSHLHKWKNAEAIIKYYDQLVYPRENTSPYQLANFPRATRMEVPLLDISATRIRNMRQARKSVQYMVPESVFEYLEINHLYAD